MAATQNDSHESASRSGAVRNDLAAAAYDEGETGGALYKTARVSYKAERFFAAFSSISRISWYEKTTGSPNFETQIATKPRWARNSFTL